MGNGLDMRVNVFAEDRQTLVSANVTVADICGDDIDSGLDLVERLDRQGACYFGGGAAPMVLVERIPNMTRETAIAVLLAHGKPAHVNPDGSLWTVDDYVMTSDPLPRKLRSEWVPAPAGFEEMRAWLGY